MPDNISISPTFHQFLEDENYGPRKKKKVLKESQELIAKSIPVIINFKHFAKCLNLDPPILGALINSPDSFYRSFTIPKRSGGKRTIEAPFPLMLETQQWILKNILNKVPISFCAHGITNNCSIVSHAAKHVPHEFLLKMDIKQFFPQFLKIAFTAFFVPLVTQRP